MSRITFTDYRELADRRRATARRYPSVFAAEDRLTVRTAEEIAAEIATARDWSELYGADGGHIDHLPGADYYGRERLVDADGRGVWEYIETPVSAPAPSHLVTLHYRPMADRSLTAARTGDTSTDWIGADAILRIAERAVSRLCGGRGYWERQDCLSYVVERILRTAPRTGRPSDVLRYIDRADRMPVTTADRSAVHRRAVSPLALARLVADWSRREARHASESMEAARENGANMSMSDARTTGADGEQTATPTPAPALTPTAARAACDQLTDRLGVGTIGGVWEALYVLLRDVPTERAAEELGTTPDAFRAKTSRGARWIRKHLPTPADLRSAMDWYSDPDTRPRKMPARPLREGTNGGAAPTRPADIDHARALCRVTLTDGGTERPREDRRADAIEALLAA